MNTRPCTDEESIAAIREAIEGRHSDRRFLQRGALVYIGMFIQNVMTLARAHGLHTCPQATWAVLPGVVRATLGIGEDQKIVCGMPLGYEDPTAPENRLVTQREPAESFWCFPGECL